MAIIEGQQLDTRQAGRQDLSVITHLCQPPVSPSSLQVTKPLCSLYIHKLTLVYLISTNKGKWRYPEDGYIWTNLNIKECGRALMSSWKY